MIATAILVYLDGTPDGEAVLPYAIRLGSANGAKILLTCTANEFEHSTARARTYLEQLITRLRVQPSPTADSVAICPVVGNTDPVCHLLTVAQRHAVTEIVVSATMKASLRRCLLKKNSVPVMVAYTIGARLQPFAGSVLVPVDGSPDAETVVPYAVTLARSANVPLVLLTVLPTIQDMLMRCGPLYPYPWIFFPNSTLEAAEGMAAQNMYHYLTNLRAEWIRPDWGRILIRLDRGNVVPGITETADILNAGLIVIAADSYRMGWQWLIPSVSDAVAYLTQRPVLVIHVPSHGGNEDGLRQKREPLQPAFRVMERATLHGTG